ncbi:MAG: hypothetical protein FGM57_01895 [Candidatus Taylorbacteria bacterium]|nr:hypothetical protein [Candidatus Taylorbacteria bacterium]
MLFQFLPKLMHVVIIIGRPSTHTVSNPDTHFGIQGRNLLLQLKKAVRLDDFQKAKKFCLCGNSAVTIPSYKDMFCNGAPTGQIGFCSFTPSMTRTETRQSILSQCAEKKMHDLELLFIFADTDPYYYVTVVGEDFVTAKLPDSINPFHALIFTKGELEVELIEPKNPSGT